MLGNALLLTALAFGSLGLGGCHLYFESEDDVEVSPEMWPDDCDAIGCDGERPDGETPDGETPDGERPDSETPDEQPPLTCETDVDCAGGCYCSDDGLCEESGFCRLNQDCAEGFACSDSGTCIPVTEPEPPATCEDLGNDESACVADEACAPVYRGVNCTSENGEACTSETAECTCESFSFDSCEDA